jgi:hypothetical protein
MRRFLVSLAAGVLLVAAAEAQCLSASTGVSVMPGMVQWSASSSYSSSSPLDDEGITSPAIAMPFVFPMAGAVGTLDQLWVNTNGVLYLTDSTLALVEPVDAVLFGVSSIDEMRGGSAGASVRIVPLGDDLEGSIEGGASWDVRIDTSVPGEVRVEWIDMATFVASSSDDTFSFAATLSSSGTIEFSYSTDLPDIVGYVGVSIGNDVGSASSPESDLTFGVDSGPEGLLFENFTTGEFDLAGKTLLLIPNGSGGFLSATTCSPAEHSTYGAGCYDQPEVVLYELYGDQAEAKAELDGNVLNYSPAPDGYQVTWVPGAAGGIFLAPSGGAIPVGIVGANGSTQISPTSPFPGPFGPIPTVTVSENGIVTLAATANDDDLSPSSSEFVGSLSTNVAFAAWRDFDLSEVGTGSVVYEEVAVGPDTVLAITWDGVEAEPSTVVNPSTFQVQLNLSTGAVNHVFVSWDPSGDSSDAVVGATLGGPVPNPGESDLAALPGLLILKKAAQPTVYELFADQADAKAELDGNGVRFTKNGSGYTVSWLPGGAAGIIAHTGAATIPFWSTNGNNQIVPSVPFPAPGGPVGTLTASENGLLTMAASPNDDDSTPSATEFVGSLSPDLAFAAWRDFNLSEFGTGPILYEEFAVGPDTASPRSSSRAGHRTRSSRA